LSKKAFSVNLQQKSQWKALNSVSISTERPFSTRVLYLEIQYHTQILVILNLAPFFFKTSEIWSSNEAGTMTTPDASL